MERGNGNHELGRRGGVRLCSHITWGRIWQNGLGCELEEPNVARGRGAALSGLTANQSILYMIENATILPPMPSPPYVDDGGVPSQFQSSHKS